MDLETREDSSSDSRVIKDFKNTVVTQLIERFELDSAHPMLIGSLLDPRFKHITLSKCKEESETRKLKESLKELMEMHAGEDGNSSLSPVTSKKRKLTTLDKLLGPENLTMEPPTFDSELEKYLSELPISQKDNPLT